MSKFPNLAIITSCVFLAHSALAQQVERLGLGRPATTQEIAAWDIDVRPDGVGLPPGQGTVTEGEAIYSEKCASCHGDFGEGVGRWPALAGGQDTLSDDHPVKTVGSFWPYLSTVWDYVNRTMPYGQGQTLTPDEIYAVTAYILYLNDLVDESFVLTRDNFTSVTLPNADGFIDDDRAQTELPMFSAKPCMTHCKDTVAITARAAILDVTPEDGQ